MQQPVFEPMTVGQILDRTFSLYRQKFVRFVAIVALIQVPIGLLMTVATVLIGYPMEQAAVRAGPTRGPEMAAGAVAAVAVGVLIFVLSLFLQVIGQCLCNAALIKGVSEAYLGRDATVAQSYRYILPRFWRILGASLLVSLVLGVGFALCVVPGVIFTLWFAVTLPAVILEDRRVTDGMSRSKFLAGGNLGKIFLVKLVVWLIGSIAALAFQYGGLGVGMLFWPATSVFRIIAGQFGQILGQVLVMPIASGATILLYYDLRIRKEGFDLEMLAQSLGSEVAPADAVPPVH